MLKIKTDKELWDAWMQLKYNIQNLASIVQNDTNLSEETFNEWLKLYVTFKNDLKKTYKETLRHVENSK